MTPSNLSSIVYYILTFFQSFRPRSSQPKAIKPQKDDPACK